MADFDAGSIVGSLDLNLDPFDQGLAKAKAEGEDFESKSYTATARLKVEQDGEVGDGVHDSDATETVHVHTDNADADAALEHTKAEADEVGEKSPTVHVNADTSAADSNISGMMALIAGLGPALIPIGAAATAVLPAIATAAGAGAAGMGVLALGVSDVTGALKNLTTEHTQSAAASAADAAQAKAQAQAEYSANQQIISSTAALKTARENAANSAITNAESIRNARQAEAQAERTAAQQETQASQAVITASYNRQQAIDSEAQAEQALSAAREQAARDLESAANKAVDANLALQQSNIDLANAQDAATAAANNATLSPAQKAQAQLDLARAIQAQREAQEAATQATEDNNKAQAAGVDGAPGVVSASQQVAAARHNVQTTTQALTAAERAQEQSYTTGARNIAKAQQAVSDAVRNAANSQRQSSESIASALRSQQAAYHAAAQAAQSSSGSSNAALAATKAQLDKVSPSVLAFAHFIQGTLEPAFQHMKNVAADGLLPGVEKGIQAILPFLPQIDHFIGAMAGAMGHLAAEAGKALTDPFWTHFFTWFAHEAVPAITAMGHVIGNLAQGFAGLLEAFSPITDKIGGGILDLSQKFADFGTHVGESSSFHSFIQYLKDNGPLIVSDIEKLASAAGHIIKALAPLGHMDLKAIGYFADAINHIPVPVLTALGAALSIIVPLLWTMSKLAGLVELMAGIATTFGIAAEGATGLEAAMALLAPEVLLVIGVVVALGLAVYELIKHWSGVSHFFEGLWHDVSHFFETAWHDIWGFVKKYGLEILSFLTGTFTIYEIVKHWSAITGFFDNLWHDVEHIFSGTISWITSHLDSLFHWIEGMPSRLGRGAEHIFDWIGNAFIGVANDVIRMWDDLWNWLGSKGFHVGGVSVLGHTVIPSFGFNFGFLKALEIPQIPALADGGIVDSPTLALIGEAGREAVVPLDGPNAAITPLQGAGSVDPATLDRSIADAIAERLAPYFQRLLDTLASSDKDSRYADVVTEAFRKAQAAATQQIIQAVRTA